MKKILFTIIALIFSVSLSYSQVTTLWEKSAATSTKPVWETGSLTRGIAYGSVGGSDLFFVVTRDASLGGKQIIYYDALTGDSLGQLDNTGITGGVAVVNDVEVSSDGKIFVGNMTTNASADAFKVYRYDALSAVPVEVLSYNATADRLGDKFTVTGSTVDNSVVIWAATSLGSAGSGSLFKFTTTDNAQTFTSAVIPISSTASSAAVTLVSDTVFYHDAHGTYPTKYTTDGTLIGSLPNTVIATSGSALRYLNTFLGDEYIVVNDLLTTSNDAKIIRIFGGVPDSATVLGSTPLLGSTTAGGLGDVAVKKVSEYIYNIYVLATNNGFGAYQVDLRSPLAGDYYIGAPGTGPGGSDPEFATLRDAFNVLNSSTFSGDCTFYITSDITETYTTVGLGLAINPDPYTVTFKPYTGVQPVITLPYTADINSGPSGALVIGIPMENNIAWNDLRTTKNIVIDGSNTVDGTTRDLTIQTATTAHRNAMTLVLVGDVSNVVVKNTNVYYKSQGTSTSGGLFIGSVLIRSRVNLSQNWIPKNLTFENNHLSSNFDGVYQNAQGIGTYQGTDGILYADSITIKNNLIEAKRRGIALYRAANCDISGNEIILNQNIASGITNEAIYAVDVPTNSVVNIYNNKISKISSLTNLAAMGNTGISIETAGTYNIYNNMIYGFELTATNPVAYVRGIKNSSATATLNLAFNSIYMADIADIGTGTVTYSGIYLSDGTNDLANNIVVSAEKDFTSYCINRTGTLGTVTSDHNDFLQGSAGAVGYWNDAATASLSDWQTASSQDANSYSLDPLFVSATDLHLVDVTSPLMGKGIAITGITTDIDGDLRDDVPEIGADEFPGYVPVELVSFTGSFEQNKVVLKWKTATELNSSYFSVERKATDNVWTSIGRVTAAGNSTNPIDYRFVDEKVAGSKSFYRLKQVDLDGSSSYSQEVEINTEVPITFALSQNYPNPFNPTTKINYSVPLDSKVTISVYSITGELVRELVNEDMAAGSYSVDFNGSNLASGMYIYKMVAGNFVQTHKMMLMK